MVNFGENLLELLRIRYILLCSGEIFCEYLFGPFVFIIPVSFRISPFNFCLDGLYVGESRVLKTSTINV